MNDKNKDSLWAMRHTAEHVLHQAVKELYPQIQLAMGPATDEGFYFDFDSSPKKDHIVRISETDFLKIEQRMKELINLDLPLIRMKISEKEAQKLFKDNPYKLEWVDGIVKKKGEITIYWTGHPGDKNSMVDLCKGPHVESTGKVGPFKLLSIAGAYWHGDEKNKMLTRIYGTCFPTQKELDKYLWQKEEAEKRDHRKLGKQLGYYLISDQVGQGLIIWKPQGAIIRRIIEDFIIKEQTKRGYKMVYSPHIGKKQLWITSGHWDLYRDKMYSPMKIDEVEYMVKPMNCPMHMMVYQSDPHSYRDLPLRISENASVYRYEQAGELSGMIRGRHFTQDDSHIFCTEEQVTNEFMNVMDYAFYFLKAFGISDYYMQLSVRDPKNKDKYLGSDAVWKNAEDKIKKAVSLKKVKFTVKEGEAAFYGPKLDFIIKDSLGREWQCGTIQIDFSLPERFKLEYIDEKGEIKRPVVIHRAIAGSLERFFAILVEHYAGAFPLWLSPIQLAILPVSDKFQDYALKIKNVLLKNNIRAELNLDNKTLGSKIRESTLQKVPYMVIIGERELESYKVNKVYKVSVRTREGKDLGLVNLYQFIEKLRKQIENFA
ncbi:threonine--tRNA ligase [Candidatus Roizmanbacteria bacterium CG_4_9_14_3_um_filter_36_11]|nr:MAG: threonine--tRNA ligase [Candidatus Roizmanbacteria bacterium CG_4_9_14_3_um_filter_36_11]